MKHTTLFVAAAGIAAAGAVIAGPLTPPAGPVTSSFKTLSDVEPRIAINATNTPGDADSMFKISWPGSYYLPDNVAAIPGKMGIEIAADDVTIDLNGFRVGGYPGALAGIKASGTNRRNINISNGSIWTISGNGIDLLGDGAAATRGCRISDITIADCTGSGLLVFQEGIVTRVIASNIAGNGIYAGSGTHIRDCTVRGCGTGILVSNSSFVESCIVSDNAGDGIHAGTRCVIVNNQCDNNGTATANGAGIHAFAIGVRIEGNSCTSNDRGIVADAGGCLIFRNSCTGGGSPWVLAAGNVYGPIINRFNLATPAVNSASAADTTTTTHPLANFTY